MAYKNESERRLLTARVVGNSSGVESNGVTGLDLWKWKRK